MLKTTNRCDCSSCPTTGCACGCGETIETRRSGCACGESCACGADCRCAAS